MNKSQSEKEDKSGSGFVKPSSSTKTRKVSVSPRRGRLRGSKSGVAVTQYTLRSSRSRSHSNSSCELESNSSQNTNSSNDEDESSSNQQSDGNIKSRKSRKSSNNKKVSSTFVDAFKKIQSSSNDNICSTSRTALLPSTKNNLKRAQHRNSTKNSSTPSNPPRKSSNGTENIITSSPAPQITKPKSKRRKLAKRSTINSSPPAIIVRPNHRGTLIAYDNAEEGYTPKPTILNSRRGFIPASTVKPTTLWNSAQMTENSTLSANIQPNTETLSTNLNNQPSTEISIQDVSIVIIDNRIYRFCSQVPDKIIELSATIFTSETGQILSKESLVNNISVKIQDMTRVPMKLTGFVNTYGIYFGHKKQKDGRQIERREFKNEEISSTFLIYCLPCRKGHLKSCSVGSINNFTRHLKEAHDLVDPGKMNLGVVQLNNEGVVSYGYSCRYNWDHARQVMGLDLLLQYFMDSNQPFSNVSKFSLKRLLNFFDPQFVLPCDRTLASLLSKKVESEVVPSLSKILQSIKSGTLVVDAWSSKSMQGVLAVSIIFIDEDFNWCQKTLMIKRILGSHTGLNISQMMLDCIDFWGLRRKIKFIVSDGGANMVKALKDLHEFSLQEDFLDPSPTENPQSSPSQPQSPASTSQPENMVIIGEASETVGFSSNFCSEGDQNLALEILTTSDESRTCSLMTDPEFLFEENMKPSKCNAHNLQLVLSDGMKRVDMAAEIHQTIKKVAAFGRKKQVAREISKAVTQKVLKRPCSTRWNSVIDCGWYLWEPNMYEVIRNLIDDARAKASEKGLKSLPDSLSEEFEYFLKEFLEISDPVSKLTDELQGNGITAHLVIPGIARAHSAILELTDLKYMKEYQVAILTSIEERMSGAVNDTDYILATVLCPYYKTIFFEMYHEDQSSSGSNPLRMPSLDFVMELCYTHLQTTAEMEPSFARSSTSSSSVVTKCPYAQRIQERYNQKKQADDSRKVEIKKYLEMPVSFESLTEFWRKNKTELPNLYEKAREIFSKPATSGLVERLFSLIADINRADRVNINVKTIEEIVMYKEFINLPKTYKDATKNIFQANSEQLVTLVEQMSFNNNK